MRILIAVFFINFLAYHSVFCMDVESEEKQTIESRTTKKTYSNDAKSLKDFISEDKFNEFYSTFMSLRAEGDDEWKKFICETHSSEELPRSHIHMASFFVVSPEITVAIPGYVAYSVEELGPPRDVGLVAYLPENNIYIK